MECPHLSSSVCIAPDSAKFPNGSPSSWCCSGECGPGAGRPRTRGPGSGPGLAVEGPRAGGARPRGRLRGAGRARGVEGTRRGGRGGGSFVSRGPTAGPAEERPAGARGERAAGGMTRRPAPLASANIRAGPACAGSGLAVPRGPDRKSAALWAQLCLDCRARGPLRAASPPPSPRSHRLLYPPSPALFESTALGAADL